MILLVCLIIFAVILSPASANTEKTIFVAPDSINLGDARPSLLDLRLDTFGPANLALRAALPVVFPSESSPRGLNSWYLLQDLTQGQRYEVRVCWSATVRFVRQDMIWSTDSDEPNLS